MRSNLSQQTTNGTMYLLMACFMAPIQARAGPVPPTGKHTSTDYVYVMQFEGDKVAHMTKIWHAGLAMKKISAGPN